MQIMVNYYNRRIMNPLIYLASYDDLAQIAIDLMPHDFSVEGITDNNLLLMHWLHYWGNLHYTNHGQHEISEGLRKAPDFDPWCYICQFPDELKIFYDNFLNINLVCFNYIVFGRVNNFSKFPKIRYLIVGSGSNIKKWWQENKKYVIENNYRIIPMNNAWKIVGAENIFRWYVPNDFHCRGSVYPTDNELNTMREIALAASKNDVKYIKKNSSATPNYFIFRGQCDIRFQYKDTTNKSGTMFINTLFSLMSEIYPYRQCCEIYIIGSDFDYSDTRNTHFYSNVKGNKASNDPLRYGNKWLKDELENVYNISKKYNYKIFNYSSNPNTMLPFPKVAFHDTSLICNNR